MSRIKLILTTVIVVIMLGWNAGLTISSVILANQLSNQYDTIAHQNSLINEQNDVITILAKRQSALRHAVKSNSSTDDQIVIRMNEIIKYLNNSGNQDQPTSDHMTHSSITRGR